MSEKNMFYKTIIVVVYIIYVSGSGIYHEHTKVTFKPSMDAEYFGYSVVLNQRRLIVGAPKAKNKDKQTGLAFNCSLDSLGSINGIDPSIVQCSPVGPGIEKHYMNRFIPDSFFKDDMWFGASMAFLSDAKLLICAPRFTEPYNSKHLLAHGVCSIRKDGWDTVINPLNVKARQAFMTDGRRPEYGEYGTHLNFYAYGQAGMSIKVIGNTSVIIGAPGLLQWTGGIINFIYKPQADSVYFSKQVIPNLYYTNDLGPDDYFGYSVEAGVFQHGSDTLFVGGAPRSAKGLGQVLIFEPSATREQNPLKVHAKISGPQLGAYFGASLCCLDMDGDGLSDLLVGAPNYVTKDGGLPYDQGAVFVYITKQMGNEFTLEHSGHIMGSGASGARFGTVIADLGDVDGDGFTDVAVGAPWENDGKGVVYIYRGYVKGLRSQYVQKLSAEGARSFGISISKGLDIDGNNCNDLTVGAAKSSTVYLYRCIPTITVHTSIKVPDAMNLPHNATGFTALFCVTALTQPLWPHVKAEFNTKIVIDPEENRAKISGNSEYKVSITPGDERCDEQIVDVKPTADLSKPISMKFFLEADELLKNDSTVFNHYAATVSEESVLESPFLIQLVRDCGEDMICTPWLEMTFKAFVDRYTPGSEDRLGARLTILNTEEPAYGARVNITLPSPPKRLPSPCSLEDLVLTCDVPAPLLRNESVSWDIELEYKENNDVFRVLKAELHDPLYNRNISKEYVKEVVLEILPIAVINVAGKPLPNDTLAVTREKLYKAENITFSHYIEILNSGPSNWILLEFTITLPETVNLSSPIKGCDTVDTGMLECAWTAPAKVSRSLVLPLRFDLAKYGELLKQNTTLHLTTVVELTDFDTGNRTATITTTLVLDPAPSIWPVILGTVAGLILFAVIVYLMYRYGFFSRQQHQRLKELQVQTQPSTPETASSSGVPSIEAAESTQELLCEDSD